MCSECTTFMQGGGLCIAEQAASQTVYIQFLRGCIEALQFLAQLAQFQHSTHMLGRLSAPANEVGLYILPGADFIEPSDP